MPMNLEQNSVNPQADTPEILTLQHLRKIVPRLEVLQECPYIDHCDICGIS
jgi:hypothetical protein